MNGYLVQLYKSLALRHALLNKNRIEVFHDSVNAFSPACRLNPSNSVGLKFGL